MNSYYPGTQIRLTGTFTVAGQVTDPTVIRCLYEKPTGVVTVVSSSVGADMTQVSTGVWRIVVTPTSSEAGTWHYAFQGTGAVIVADYGGAFQVIEPPFST